ncbi:MAG TPA: hypothetical protein EYF95_06765 [Flavobacteriales bacterium]|nr:hypothetical protein [Flavobacteriales bacterium]
MLESQFENIRPFFDNEAAEAATNLAKVIDWAGLLAPLVGKENAVELAKNMLQVDSISDFQDDLTYPFLEALIESTTDGVTLGYSSGAFEKDLESPTLHLTNHRDIVLDPSLVNVARMGSGFPSTEIGIGDNLLSHKWLEDLVRLNRCFIVRRGGGPRERWESSLLVATYIRYVVKNGNSVWLAQKEGRAKDGKDSTSPALIRMLISEGGKEAWEKLNVKPVSISYEWDPCDYMKVRELLIKENEGEYLKEQGEDEMSMASGMTGWKGKIHLEFCKTVPWKEVEGKRTERAIAELVDRAIYMGYKIFPNQVIAADRLGLEELVGFASEIKVTDEDRTLFSNRIDKVVEEVGTNIASKEKIQKTFCEIMVQPLLAKYKVSLESKSF